MSNKGKEMAAITLLIIIDPALMLLSHCHCWLLNPDQTDAFTSLTLFSLICSTCLFQPFNSI